jgi:hypothetical protein
LIKRKRKWASKQINFHFFVRVSQRATHLLGFLHAAFTPTKLLFVLRSNGDPVKRMKAIITGAFATKHARFHAAAILLRAPAVTSSLCVYHVTIPLAGGIFRFFLMSRCNGGCRNTIRA